MIIMINFNRLYRGSWTLSTGRVPTMRDGDGLLKVEESVWCLKQNQGQQSKAGGGFKLSLIATIPAFLLIG